MTREEIMFWQDEDEGVTGWYVVYFDEGGETNFDAIGPYNSAEEAQKFAPQAFITDRVATQT